ncbi:hypothetical protein EJ110_NYTH17454 [Nymphaea thermarum]|nr:hypothetical protein EJ110_NYTH17454 [Nymphaea thermarum]
MAEEDHYAVLDLPTGIEGTKTSYEILVDAPALRAYDDLLKLKHEKQQSQISAKRRKMMDKLAEEERGFASNAKSQAEKDREEIERAKKKIEERILAKQASSTFSKKENLGNNAPQPVSLDKNKIIEVTWRYSKDVSDVQLLNELFGKFGVVEDVVIRSKMALVVMISSFCHRKLLC